MSSSGADLVLLSRHAGIATITFNRPKELNAIDLAMSHRLADIAHDIPQLPERVIVLRGTGQAFMAGGDVKSFGRATHVIPLLEEIIGNFHTFVLALASASQPVVAVVHGAAAGAGLSLALGCDFSLVSSDAKLSFAYRRLGTSPDGGCTYLLQRLVGRLRATELLLCRDSLTAAEAHRLGLLTWLVPHQQIETRLQEVTAGLAAASKGASCAVKRLLRDDLDSFERHLEAEKRAFLACALEADFKEGVLAFMEKRVPYFQ